MNTETYYMSGIFIIFILVSKYFDPKRASDLVSEEVSTSGSLEEFSSEVFINGSLPENLSSSPLLPLYKSVVRTMLLPSFPSS